MEHSLFYLRPKKEISTEYKVNKSRFIGHLFFVQTQEKAREKIQHVSELHKQATHNCWAFKCGYPESIETSSDAGEPSGTAGAPILGVINKNQLDNTLIVVTRYFGGTKLGIRGLIDAYRTASNLALEKAGIMKAFPAKNLKIKTDYQNITYVTHVLKSYVPDNTVPEQIFDIQVTSTYPVLLNRVVEAGKLAEMLLKTKKIVEYKWEC